MERDEVVPAGVFQFGDRTLVTPEEAVARYEAAQDVVRRARTTSSSATAPSTWSSSTRAAQFAELPAFRDPTLPLQAGRLLPRRAARAGHRRDRPRTRSCPARTPSSRSTVTGPGTLALRYLLSTRRRARWSTSGGADAGASRGRHVRGHHPCRRHRRAVPGLLPALPGRAESMRWRCITERRVDLEVADARSAMPADGDPRCCGPSSSAAASLGAVLVIVLVLLVLTPGRHGLLGPHPRAPRWARSCAALRTSLAQTISDPDAVERRVEARRAELEPSYGLDRAWYERLPGVVGQVLVFDLGEARSVRAAERQQRHRRHHRRAPAAHDAAADDLAAHHGRHRPAPGRLALHARGLARRPHRELRGGHHQRPAGLVGGHPAHPRLLVLAAHPALRRHVQHAATGGRRGLASWTSSGTPCCPS